MIITIFEDQNNQHLYPLNQIRASFELRCGAFTNLERIQNSLNLNDEIQLIVRNEIQDIIKERYPNITVNSGVAVTVGSGKTMIIDVLQIGDL